MSKDTNRKPKPDPRLIFEKRPLEEQASQDELAAGWYADANHPGQQRYWDGKQWTDRFRPTPRPISKDTLWAILGAVFIVWLVAQIIWRLSGGG